MITQCECPDGGEWHVFQNYCVKCKTPAEIHFLKLKDPYGCLGNFWKAPIRWDWLSWPTSEHLYQALKYYGTDPEYMEKVRTQETAWLAAKVGREGPNLREDWEEVKLSVMYHVLRAKFTQHEDIRLVLMSTGKAVLHEHFSKDSFWADGGDGSGDSYLGKLLMKLRESLVPVFGAVTRSDVIEAGYGPLIGHMPLDDIIGYSP